jgi:hypothetical protein
MAEFKLGRIKFVYQGTWAPSTSYVVDDVVTVGGKTYICVISNTSSSSFTTDLNNITPYWNLVADGSRWTGTWTNSTTYQLGDLAIYGGIVYECTTAHTSASSTATIQTTGITLNGTSATITFAQQAVQPYLVGATITLAGFSPSSTSGTVNTVNTTFTVVTCSTTQVTFALTGTYTAATLGTVSGASQLGLEANQSSWATFAANFNWSNTWTTNTRYKVRDLVSYGGYTYVCNTAHVSANTASVGLETNDSAKWNTFNPGIMYKGAWASSTRYKLNDIVTYGADLWICTAYHTSSGSTLDNTKFSIFVNGFEFQNSWSSSSNYIVGDMVTYGGYTYTAVQNGINQTPSTATAYWQPFTTGFTFQGDWNNSTAYKIGSIVRVGGYTYLAKVDVPSGATYVPTNTTYWNQLNSGIRWNPTQNTYSAQAGTRLTGSGTSATFDITASNTVYSAVVHSGSAGTGYAIGDTIKVLGTSLGGLSPVNDVVLTVASITGGSGTGPIATVTTSGISVSWSSGVSYVLGDVVFFAASSYICVISHVASSGNRPDADTSGTYWNILASGTEQAVLTTQGDMFFYGTNGPQRLPIGSDGQVLRVVNNAPAWQYYGQINNVVYVSTNGVDSTSAGQGTTIDKPWATIRFACQQIEAGYLNTNAGMLLTMNKQFMMKEVNNYIQNQYSVNVTGTSGTTITVGGSSTTSQITTANLYQGMPIVFANSSGNIVAGTTYYVASIGSSTTFTVATTYANSLIPTLFTVGTGTANTGTYSYSSTKAERDAGLIIQGVIFDITHGGTYQTTTNANSFFSNGSYVSGVNTYDITPFVSSLNYLKNTLFTNVLANTAPGTNYQTLIGITSGNQAIQQINTNYTAESAAISQSPTLVSIVTTALVAGTNINTVPAVINPTTTISVKTGTYNEILPINVPAYTAIVGDELRSTVVQPYAADPQLATVVSKAQAGLTRIQSLIPNLMSNTSITPTSGNTVAQVTSLPAGSTGSTTAITNLQSSFNILYELVASGLVAEPAIVMPQPTNFNTSSLTNVAYATTTGSNTTGDTTGYGYAITQIQQNYAFLISDTLNYLANNPGTSGFTMSGSQVALGTRDIRYILDSILYDLTYGGNTQSLTAGGAYYSLYLLQITATQQAAYVAALSRLKSIINLVVQKLSVASNGGVSAGNTVSQITSGSAGSSAAGGFAQDRVQNVINWITNGSADATVAPYYGWASSALQTAYTSITSLTSNIASDATVWVSKYYQSVTFNNSSLINRDATLITNAMAYDMVFGSNFNAVQAGRAFNRANTSATNLRSSASGELPPTLGAINFLFYKMKQIAASGASAQIQTTIDDINNLLSGGSAPPQITWNQQALPLATYTGVTALSVTGGGDGTAAFTITRSSNGNGYYNYVITPTVGGTSYTTSSKLRISGASIGGVTPTNDITLNVTQVNSGAVQVVTYSDPSSSVGLLESNRAFLLAETIAYINANYSSITSNPNYTVAKTQRDAGYVLDAIHYDLIYGGNWASQQAGMAYYSALYGSQISSGLTTAFTASLGYISTLAQQVIVGTTVASPLQATIPQVLPTASGYVGSTRDAGRFNTLMTLVTNFVSNGLTNGAPTITVTAIASTNTFTSNGHGLSNGDIVIPQTSTNGLVSTIIGSGTPYFVVGATTNTFQLASSYAGSALSTFTNGTGLSIALQYFNMPYLGWVSSSNIAAYTSVTGSIATYQSSVISFINTNYSALSYNSTYAQRDVFNVTLATQLDMMLGSNYAAVQAGRAYNRTQDYQVVGYEKTATVASLNYLETLIASTLASYTTQLTAVNSSIFLIINMLQNGSRSATPQVNGTITYNNNLGIIKGAEILRANIPFLAAEVVAYYNANFGGTVSSISTSVINTSANHNFNVNDPVIFTGTNAGGLTMGLVYYVASVPSTTSFTVTTAEGYSNSNTGATYTPVQLSTASSPTMTVAYYQQPLQTQNDITYFLNAIVYDLQYTGNYRSLRYAQVLLNAINGSAQSNMWLVRNACGIRNMTMSGLTGQLLSSVNGFGTKRPTGGAFTSLDPGFGPNDSNAWVYGRSCYVQNCTMFGYAVVGAKVDGALHAGGYRSMVANDYTCIIGDGIGWQTTGAGSLSELVSVFNYYSYAGYLAELGGRIRATNGNSSYGTYGVVAEGVDTTETPIYATLNNRAFQAQITNVVTDGTNQILRLEYQNAGSNYTNSVPTVSGSGYNIQVTQDEFRDASIFESRIIDLGTTSNPSVGGTSYVTTSNVGQVSTIGNVLIAATDTALSNAYNGMRIQIVAGTGVGQYANIIAYTNGNKTAQIIKDSFTPLVITSTSSTNNLLTVASTASLYVGMPVYLESNIDNLTGVYQSGIAGVPTLYYVIAANFSSTKFALSTLSGGSAVSLAGVAGSTVTVTATNITNNLITASNTLYAGQAITFGTSFNGIDAGTIYYVITANLSTSSFSVSTVPNGPAVTITATGSVSATGTVGTALYAAGWDHVIPGTTIQNNLDLTSGYIIEPRIIYSAPGYTSTARTLPATATWSAVTYGAGNFVAVSNTAGARNVAYSTNGTSWTSNATGLPSGGSNVWSSIAYGGGQGAVATAVVGGFGGSGAVLTPIIGTGTSATQIVGITVTNGGYNYTTPPTIVIVGGNGAGATATCTVLNGAIQSVTMVINGSGYTASPTVNVVTSTLSSITTNSWGKNYNSATVTISQPQGLSPTAWSASTSVSLNAYLQTTTGKIYQVTTAGTTGSTAPTTDYTSATTTNITDGSAKLSYIATQAQATASLTNSGVSTITLGVLGYGYTSIPTVTIIDSTAGFVAISSATTAVAFAAVSALGSNWTSSVSNASSNQSLQSVAFGGGYYVAVGGASGTGTAATSNNGTTWLAKTPTVLSGSAYYSSVCYGANNFVAVSTGSSNVTSYSSNSGANWASAGVLPASTNWISVAYGNNRYVALAANGSVAYTFSGSLASATAWTAAPTCSGTTTSALSSSYTWSAIKYAEGLFFAITSGSQVSATSPDGINWTVYAVGLPSSSAWTALAFGNPISNTLGAQPIWVAVSNTSGTIGASIRTGTQTRGRVKVLQASGNINEVRLVEPGSGYSKGNVTTTGTSLITVDDTTNLSTSLANNQPIEFTGMDAYGLTSNVTYYVIGSTVTTTQFSVTSTLGSTVAVTLTAGSGLSGTYRAAPNWTIVDPNHVTTVGLRLRMSDGTLANPSFINRGTNNATATASTLGDGYADIYQNTAYINVSGLFSIPSAGANVQFASITGTSQWYKLVAITNVLGANGNYTAQFQVNPSLTTLLAPVNGTLITTRLKYSQVRLTGHDFLYIGTGNQTQTNYPYVIAANAIQANQELQTGGGRVFFTSTDQDGNFNVGNLFGVQQSTGTATLNASAFNLAGLQSLTLGAVSLGVGSATITQFSTDPYFTANSDNVLPTQKAIKSFITAQIGGGASSLNVNTLTAGAIQIGVLGNNQISNSNGTQIYVSSKMLFTGGIDGAPVALSFFGQR